MVKTIEVILQTTNEADEAHLKRCALRYGVSAQCSRRLPEAQYFRLNFNKSGGAAPNIMAQFFDDLENTNPYAQD